MNVHYLTRHGPKMLHGVPKNEPRRAQDDPKRGQRRPKTTLRGTQEAQKSDPESQDEKRTEPRRSQDRLGPPTVRFAYLSRPPPGLHLGGQNGTKIDPKTIKNRSENSRRKKGDPRRSWTHLGAILGRSWPHLGVILDQKPLENVMFREKSLFRR